MRSLLSPWVVAPRWCAAPGPVWSLSLVRSAFPSPWCPAPARGLSPPDLLGGCTGRVEAGREPGSWRLPLAPSKAGALGSLRVVPARGPAMGVSLAGPSSSGLGLRARGGLACVEPVIDASSFPYRSCFDGGLRLCTGALSCGSRQCPFRFGGRRTRVPRVGVCVCSPWPGRAGRPPGRVLVRLTFPLAVLSFFFAWPPPGWGCPCLFSFFFPVVFSFLAIAPPLLARPLSVAFCAFPPRVPLALALCVSSCPPHFFFLLFLSSCALRPCCLWI